MLATVVSTTDSAPRGLGAQLAVDAQQLWVGGVTGGCAEVELLTCASELCSEAGADHDRRAVLLHMTHNVLGAAGPVCGATLGVVVERVDDELLDALEQTVSEAHAGSAIQLRRTYRVQDQTADGHGLALTRVIAETRLCDDRAALSAVSCEQHEGALIVDEIVSAAPHVVLGGAGDVAAELTALARRLGWRSTLVDPRGRFVDQLLSQATPDRVLRSWPQACWDGIGVDSRTACLALAHDGKLDIPFLREALVSEAFHVGLIGSRLVQRQRRNQLAEELDEDSLDRLSGPAGLDLGGSAAAEIALSIAAETVAALNGRTGSPLTTGTGPIRAT